MSLIVENFGVRRTLIGAFDGVMPRAICELMGTGTKPKLELVAAGQNLTSVSRGFQHYWVGDTNDCERRGPLESRRELFHKYIIDKPQFPEDVPYRVEHLERTTYCPEVTPASFDRGQPFLFSDKIMLEPSADAELFQQLAAQVVPIFEQHGWTLVFAGFQNSPPPGCPRHFQNLWRISEASTVRSLRIALWNASAYAELQQLVVGDYQVLLNPTPYGPTHAPPGRC